MNRNQLDIFKIVLEIFLSIGLITYFTYKQTNISEQQLEISKKQQKILDYQYQIDLHEHSPKFDFYTTKDTIRGLLTETIYVENIGYFLNSYDVKTYTFLELEIDTSITQLIPLELYYGVGLISNNSQGEIARYINRGNYKTYINTRDSLHIYKISHDWFLNKFDLVEIKYRDFKNEQKTVFLCNRDNNPNLQIEKEEGINLIKKYKRTEKISIYDLTAKKIIHYHKPGSQISKIE